MNVVLILIALLTLGAAAVAMSLRNLIHSVLLLIGSWTSVAAFYLWSGAEFVSFAQLLVYVGAVSMVTLFAVLLTRRSRLDVAIAPDSFARAVSGLLAGGSILLLLAGAVIGTALPGTAAAAPKLTVRELGLLLMGDHAAALLIVGLILTVALIGGVVIAATDRPEKEKETPST